MWSPSARHNKDGQRRACGHQGMDVKARHGREYNLEAALEQHSPGDTRTAWAGSETDHELPKSSLLFYIDSLLDSKERQDSGTATRDRDTVLDTPYMRGVIYICRDRPQDGRV